MKTLAANFGRFVALLITIAMLGSSMAMAGYVCPKAERQWAELAAKTSHVHGMGTNHVAHAGDEPDGSRETGKTPCVQQHAGNKLALEHADGTPSAALPAIISVRTLMPAEPPAWQILAARPAQHDHCSQPPPFLSTLRLRI